MPLPNDRIRALENLISRYSQTLQDFAAIREELQMLPGSLRLNEILELNEASAQSTRRLLEVARAQLEREKERQNTAAPFGALAGQSKSY